MDQEQGNEVWEAENKDLKIGRLIQDIVGNLKEKSKSSRDSYVLKFLRDILEEKRLLEVFND